MLRFYILKVAQQTRKHHDKITSVDEFAKRIFSVIYSNDPIARALTLRLVPPPPPSFTRQHSQSGINSHHLRARLICQIDHRCTCSGDLSIDSFLLQDAW